MAFLPFSSRAKAWETIALELRQLVGCKNGAAVDPTVLADKVGLQLVDANWAVEDFSPEDRQYLMSVKRDAWSGGVMPEKLPNGKCICILNPKHPPRRNRITLMEEIVHIYRYHTPTGLRELMPGLRVRDYNKNQEAEAYGVGAAVLLPWHRFYHDLDAGRSIYDISENHDVTEELVKYRIKISGATNLYRSRVNPVGAIQKRQPMRVVISDEFRSLKELG